MSIKIKNAARLLIILFALFPAFTSAQQASSAATSITPQKSKISGNAELNYRRRYLWRGAEFGNDYVSQPEINLEYKNFRLYLSSYFNLKPSLLSDEFYSKHAFFDEQDVEFAYVKETGKFELEGGLSNYFYFFQPEQPDVTELYANITFHLNEKISFFTENAFGLRGYKNGFFSNNGAQLDLKFFKHDELTFKLYAGCGNKVFNEANYGLAKTALTYFGNSVNYTKNFGNNYLFINLEGNLYNGKAIRDATALNGSTNYSFGIGKNF